MSSSVILCIEDDLTMQAIIAASLPDYTVNFVSKLSEADAWISRNALSAILVDIQLPDGDGLRWLGEFNQKFKNNKIPLLVISGQVDLSKKIAAFTLGAEDFISKPFDPLELRARVISKINKNLSREEKSKTRTVGDLLIDFDRQKVFLENGNSKTDLQVSTLEIKVLALLTKRLEQVYTREQMIQLVWENVYISDRTIDSHVSHLRKKLQNSLLKIESVKGLGYRAVVKQL